MYNKGSGQLRVFRIRRFFMSENARHFCLNCGGELTGTTDEWLTCKYCGSRFENRSFLRRTQYLKELLNEISVEYVNNQRRNLFDAVNAKHISTTEIRQYAAIANFSTTFALSLKSSVFILSLLCVALQQDNVSNI